MDIVEEIPEMHTVAEYAGISLLDALQLPIDLYLAIRRAAYIDLLKKTPAGREYLKTAERLQNKEVDIKGVEEMKKTLNENSKKRG